jgi:hypothetical protein
LNPTVGFIFPSIGALIGPYLTTVSLWGRGVGGLNLKALTNLFEACGIIIIIIIIR